MSKVHYLSASSVRTFQQCRLKFYYNYVKRIPQTYSDILILGIAVHEALEYMYDSMKGKNRFPNDEEKEEIRKAAIKVVAEKGIETTWVMDQLTYLLDLAFDKYNPIEKVIDVERRFKLFTPEGVPLVGSIDKIIELQPDTLGIIDYKTSFVALTQDEIDTDIQLSVYDVAAAELYPEYSKVVLILDYLRHGQVTTTRTEEQRKMFREFLSDTNEEIKKLDKENAVPTINKYCSWCDFRNICESYSKIHESAVSDVRQVHDMSDDELIEEWDNLKITKKLLDNRIDELKMYIVNGLREDGKKSISGDEGSLYVTQQSRLSYDVSDISKVIPIEDLFSLVSINNKRLNNYLNLNSQFKERIERMSTKSFSSPMLRKGK